MIFVHAKAMAFSEVFRCSEATRLPKATRFEDLTADQQAAEDWDYDVPPVPLREVSKAIVPDPGPLDDEPSSSSVVKRAKPKE